MVGLVALYQHWVPFGVGLTIVIAHHGVLRTLHADAVYGSSAGERHPWLWAALHGGFVLAASATHLASWRLNEQQGLHDPLTAADVQAAIAAGDVTDLATQRPWQPLAAYEPWTDGCVPGDGHPALADASKAVRGTEVPNFNAECFVRLYDESQANAVAMIRREPLQYLADRRLALIREFERPLALSVHDLIAELDAGVDWVLVEGFRHADLPKVEVWREPAPDAPPRAPHYAEDAHVVAIATDAPRRLPHPTALPVLDVNDADAVVAWLLAQAPWIVPIPGTTKLHRLEENLGGANITLDAAELKAIDTALAQIRIEGERYPEALKARVGR